MPRPVLEALPGSADAATALSVLAGLLVAAILAVRIGSHRARRARRDPQRGYSADQRRVCFARAGHRCELSVLGLLRCQRPAAHADHHYPWARGGATTLTNAVAACAHHNQTKGATLPSRGQTVLIAWRRRHYYPVGAERAPGQWSR